MESLFVSKDNRNGHLVIKLPWKIWIGDLLSSYSTVKIILPFHNFKVQNYITLIIFGEKTDGGKTEQEEEKKGRRLELKQWKNQES